MTDEHLRLLIFAIVLVILLLLSAFFSGFESAINSLNKYQFDTYYKKKKKDFTHKVVDIFLKDMQMTLSSILIGNTLTNIGATTLSTIFFTDIAKQAGASDIEALGAGLATGVMTFLTLIFGEFIPKIVARRNNLLYVRKLSWVMYGFFVVTWPLSWLLTRMFKQKKVNTATESELNTLVELIEREGVLESKEASLVRNAIKFDETRITQIMTKYENTISINYSFSKEIIAKTLINNNHSRLPIIRENKIIGFVTFRDFFIKYTNAKEFNIDEIIRPVIFVSQYHTLDDVLQEMQVQQCHLGVVTKNTDSQKIMGIITMEDLMEELVGEIYDETDKTKAVFEINDFTWRVNENILAHKFFKRHFHNIKVDQYITIKQWIKVKFKIKRFAFNKKYENQDMVVHIKKNNTDNKIVFIIQKKKVD